MADRPTAAERVTHLAERAERTRLTYEEGRILREAAKELTADLERARDVAVQLENENARLEARTKEAKEQARVATVHAYRLQQQTPDAAQRTLDHVRAARTWCALWVHLGMYYGIKPEECGAEARDRRTTAERIAEERAAELGKRLEESRARAERAEQQLAAVLDAAADEIAANTPRECSGAVAWAESVVRRHAQHAREHGHTGASAARSGTREHTGTHDGSEPHTAAERSAAPGARQNTAQDATDAPVSDEHPLAGGTRHPEGDFGPQTGAQDFEGGRS